MPAKIEFFGLSLAVLLNPVCKLRCHVSNTNRIKINRSLIQEALFFCRNRLVALYQCCVAAFILFSLKRNWVFFWTLKTSLLFDSQQKSVNNQLAFATDRQLGSLSQICWKASLKFRHARLASLWLVQRWPLLEPVDVVNKQAGCQFFKRANENCCFSFCVGLAKERNKIRSLFIYGWNKNSYLSVRFSRAIYLSTWESIFEL